MNFSFQVLFPSEEQGVFCHIAIHPFLLMATTAHHISYYTAL